MSTSTHVLNISPSSLALVRSSGEGLAREAWQHILFQEAGKIKLDFFFFFFCTYFTSKQAISNLFSFLFLAQLVPVSRYKKKRRQVPSNLDLEECKKTSESYFLSLCKIRSFDPRRVAEVAREHGWHPPKSSDSDENFKPEHTPFCRELRFVAIYALFFWRSLGIKSAFLGKNSASWARSALLHGIYCIFY